MGGTSYPTTPPRRETLQRDAMRGMAVAILAAAGKLSLPAKKSKLQHGEQGPIFATKPDAEWQKVYNNVMFKMKTAGAVIQALELLEIGREENMDQGEEEEKKVNELRE